MTHALGLYSRKIYVSILSFTSRQLGKLTLGDRASSQLGLRATGPSSATVHPSGTMGEAVAKVAKTAARRYLNCIVAVMCFFRRRIENVGIERGMREFGILNFELFESSSDLYREQSTRCFYV